MFVRPGRCDWHPWMSGNACTGYSFGRGKVQARIYNKTNNVKGKHDDWYLELLRQRNGAAFNPDLPVYRLEFQLLRDGVKGFKLYAKPDMTDDEQDIPAEIECEDLEHIGSVRWALRFQAELWSYLTRRWLRLVEPDDDANRARWPVHPTWRVLQEGYAQAQAIMLTEDQRQLVRKQRHTGYERFLHRIEVGVLAMVDAMQTNAVEVVHEWLAHLRDVLALVQQQQQEHWQRWHSEQMSPEVVRALAEE